MQHAIEHGGYIEYIPTNAFINPMNVCKVGCDYIADLHWLLVGGFAVTFFFRALNNTTKR